MRFRATLALIQGWSNKAWKYALLLTFLESSFECGFRYPFERVWMPIFMIFEAILLLVHGWSNQHWKYALYWFSRNWNFKVDLDNHLRDKHGHLFLWHLELFWPLFRVIQTNVGNMHFCQLSRNWVLKVDLGTYLRHKQRNHFLLDL